MASTAVDYARVAFDLIEEIDRTDTPEQAVERLASALSAFDYEAFLVTGVPEPQQRVEPYFLLNGWPRGRTARHANENRSVDDAVAGWRGRAASAFEWLEAGEGPQSGPEQAVAQPPRRVGVKRGALVPIIRASGQRACVTMAGVRPNIGPRAKRAIHLVSVYAHAKAVSLLGMDGNPTGQRALTDREREVLQWTAAGKSSWDISVILGISERTVNWLIASSGRKLGAVNRTQAVVKAIRAGEIDI